MTLTLRAYLGIALFSATAFGQQSASPPTPADARITLDIVAKDKSGKPVTGLQEQDFTVLDNKQPQKILSFEAAGARDADQAVEVVLVVDSVNISFHNVAYERDQIQNFLKQDGGRLAFPVSIAFLSDSGLDLPGTTYRDGNALIAYLNGNKTALRWMNRSQGFYGAADRLQLSLRALGQLAEYEEQRPGRKIVVWLSPGWALFEGPNIQLTKKNQQELFNAIVAMSTGLRRSRITLYAVDPLGTADAGHFRTFEYNAYLKGVKEPKQAGFGNLALQVLAVQSGGRVLNSNNDVAGEIAASVRDADSYYILSFAAQPGDGPDEYHAVEVTITRPELKAQTRSGYYAQPVLPTIPAGGTPTPNHR